MGQKLSEESIITEDEELSIIAKLNKNDSDTDFLYVAHRGDTDGKLHRLRQLGVFTVRLNVPIELWLRVNLAKVTCLQSFFSTALFTSRMIAPELKLQAFPPPTKHLTAERRKSIDAVVSHFREYDIEVGAHPSEIFHLP